MTTDNNLTTISCCYWWQINYCQSCDQSMMINQWWQRDNDDTRWPTWWTWHQWQWQWQCDNQCGVIGIIVLRDHVLMMSHDDHHDNMTMTMTVTMMMNMMTMMTIDEQMTMTIWQWQWWTMMNNDNQSMTINQWQSTMTMTMVSIFNIQSGINCWMTTMIDDWYREHRVEHHCWNISWTMLLMTMMTTDLIDLH